MVPIDTVPYLNKTYKLYFSLTCSLLPYYQCLCAHLYSPYSRNKNCARFYNILIYTKMKCILVVFCALAYFSFNSTKASPVIDSMFDQYHPISLSYMEKINDKLATQGHVTKGYVFDAVRKHYEMDDKAADDSFEYSPMTIKYSKSLLFNKAKYTKTFENEIEYEFDSDITTAVTYSPVGDVYLDSQDSSINNNDINKRYLSDVRSEIRNDNNLYKSQKENEFESGESDLDMSNENEFPDLLVENGNEMLSVSSSVLKKPRRIELSPLKNNRIDIIQ